MIYTLLLIVAIASVMAKGDSMAPPSNMGSGMPPVGMGASMGNTMEHGGMGGGDMSGGHPPGLMGPPCIQNQTEATQTAWKQFTANPETLTKQQIEDKAAELASAQGAADKANYDSCMTNRTKMLDEIKTNATRLIGALQGNFNKAVDIFNNKGLTNNQTFIQIMDITNDDPEAGQLLTALFKIFGHQAFERFGHTFGGGQWGGMHFGGGGGFGGINATTPVPPPA